MKKIVLVPYGGLCNRLRVIASGIKLANDLGMELEIVWNKIPECFCRFDELFQAIQIPVIESDGTKYQWPSKNNLFIPYLKGKIDITKTYLWDCSVISNGGIFHKIFKHSKARTTIDYSKLLCKKKNIIVTCECLTSDYDVTIFKPSNNIKVKIDKEAEYFSEQTYGLHIRRTDNKESIKNSPTELFFGKIMQTLSLEPNSNFYVSTDDQEIKTELVSKFGSKIITYNAELSRESEKGMEDALVELFLLSKTKKIYGSWWSSYSEMAAKIGGIELEVLKK